jgi:3-isopropylmalate/(R)-2-methylmalate dehydratase large subunit
MAQTLYDKLWQSHVVHTADDGTAVLYIDRHLIHEVTSPQAFEGLKLADRQPWRTSANLVVADHNVPTTNRAGGIADPISRLQVETLDQNAKDYALTYFNMNDKRQGIVHVIGPEQGATLPGMTVSAATRIRPPMVHLPASRMASAPPRSSTCWPRRHCSQKNPRRC